MTNTIKDITGKSILVKDITDFKVDNDGYRIVYTDHTGTTTTLVDERNYFKGLNSTVAKDDSMVDHPQHYKASVECIDVMQEIFGKDAVKNFCTCNAFKYLFRCENKENKVQDIKKAKWYLDKYLELENGN